MNKKQILIITTKKCCGCEIQIKNVSKAIDSTNKSIELKVRDFADVSGKLIYENKITDYPATLFINNDVVVFKYIGSCPIVMLQRFIDVYLK